MTRTIILAVARAWCFGLVVFAAGSLSAVAAAVTDVPVLTADGLGKGTVTLDGPWQFHLGDNPDWASRALDDASGHEGWEQLTADRPWGEQGHQSYAGYAWYRRHLHLQPAASASPDFSLLIPRVEDVYEVYWNGVLLGKEGKFPPGSRYPYNRVPQIYQLGQARDGVLAVRVWKAPLDSFDTGLQGGFLAPPLAGSAAALTDRKTDFNYRWLRNRQYLFALNALTFLVMALSLVAWLRNRSQKLLLWMSLFALSSVLGLLLYTDGLLEARATTGELFSFDRLRSLIQQKPSAEEATKAATDFGQEDDITVLTLTRLAKGEAPSTHLKAPALAPA